MIYYLNANQAKQIINGNKKVEAWYAEEAIKWCKEAGMLRIKNEQLEKELKFHKQAKYEHRHKSRYKKSSIGSGKR